MELLPLLGKKLKDDDVIDFFNDYDVEEVTYAFDRSHENMDDVYWAPNHKAGFQIRFDKDQIADTIFCYVTAKEGFAPIKPELIGAPVYRTFDEAESACKISGVSYSIPNVEKWPNLHKKWLRVESSLIWVHYEFKDGQISMVTLMTPVS